MNRCALLVLGGLVWLVGAGSAAWACTGVTLRAADGSVVFARTLEWGAFDLDSHVRVVPRGVAFRGETPNGRTGLAWESEYGFVAFDALGRMALLDGMNEAGLSVGQFYHPTIAEYAPFDASEEARSIGPTDIVQYLLSTCATTEEARAAMASVRVVPVVEPSLGFPAPVHLMVTDPGGAQVVIEFLGGEMVVADAPLGVITNAPEYSWHETNLRNYVNLSPVGMPTRSVGDIDFAPLGGGSGMIGLPGDFTPPSRFVRAVAFTQTARGTVDGVDAMQEAFRVLDNFNVPLGAAEGENASEGGGDATGGMKSATLWTVANDTRNKVIYYHTQHNRRVRQIDLKSIDFDALDEMRRAPMDARRAPDIEDVTARLTGG